MPETPTTYMLLVLPTPGSDSDLWDDLINTALGGANGIDSHNHTPGRGRQVPTAGIGIDDDLPLNGKRLRTVTGLEFVALGSNLAVGAREVFVGPDNNLYYRNAAGQNVRITNGSTLDVTSVGGIAGDYSAIGAEVAYVDATDTYTMRQQLAAAVRQFARVACAGVDLFEYRAAGVSPVPSTRVRLSSPPALAGSYELTFPGALPVAQSICQVTSAGQLVFSNTVPAITLNTNDSITLSGTGVVKHGIKTRSPAVVPPQVSPGAPFTQRFATISGSGSGASSLYVPVILDVGQRIVNLRVRATDNISGTTRVQAQLYSQTAGGTLTPVVGGQTNQSLGNSTIQTVSATGINAIVAASTTYFVEVFNATGSANCFIWWIEIDFDQP